MSLEFQDRWFDKVFDPSFVTPLFREDLRRVGPTTVREVLLDHGYAEWWLDQPPSPGKYYSLQPGARVFQNGRVEQVDTWAEFTAQQKRDSITGNIEAQVVDGMARELVEDPTFHRTIESTSGGASERKSDLEDTEDVDLDAFDTAIVPTPADGVGFIEARMTTFIDEVEPWAGAPGDDLALRVVLEILGAGDVAAGASARAHMFGPKDGPAGSVMTFTQDTVNLAIWESKSQIGRYWADREQTASMRLLWNNGSLPVAETKLIQGFGDKHSAVVRAPI